MCTAIADFAGVQSKPALIARWCNWLAHWPHNPEIRVRSPAAQHNPLHYVDSVALIR